uniref:Uncharacterized protein n=1 Tax=Globisporangium ultimum (strain ATCC 200006 / CBS 805.95 / DAOM BR144) TaxID=431595 RepID=K3X0X6_GLOUD
MPDYPLLQRANNISHLGEPTKKANPALWESLNCTEYLLHVRALTSAAAVPVRHQQPSWSCFVMVAAAILYSLFT